LAINSLNKIIKKTQSIFFSINFVFLIALSSVSATFWLYIKLDREQHLENILNRYIVAARMLLSHNPFFYTLNDAKQDLQAYGLDLVLDKDLQKNILSNALLLKHKTLPKGEANIISYKKQIYIFVSIFDRNLLLKDYSYHPYYYGFTALAFFSSLIILMISYLIIARKLYPIKQLRREIINFGEGKFNFNYSIDAQNEIADVANEFNKVARQINNLIQSRSLFLRNIMHELKTPITKGKLSVEMLENSKQKDRLKNVFYRLESLINEFASIEKISAGVDMIDFKQYRMVDLLDNAIDLAMIESEQIKIKTHDEFRLNADFELLSVAIKNMIDNGIKYSIDKKIEVFVDEKEITFKNHSKSPLSKPLKYYIEPFTKDSNNNPNSFGLGLYIVQNILKLHNLELEYNYQNEYTYFKFKKHN